MAQPTPPTPEPEDDLFAAPADKAEPPLDLSGEKLFDREPAPDDAPAPRADRPPGPVFRASLADAVWLLWRRATGRGVTDLTCRGCGYPARGLTRLACPECGADFVQNGLIDPTDTRLGLVAVAAGWTLALAAGASVMLPYAQRHLLPVLVQRSVMLEVLESEPAASPHRLTFVGERAVLRWPHDASPLDDGIQQMTVYLGDRLESPAACDLKLTDQTYAFRPGGKPLFSGFPATGKLDDDAVSNWILFTGFDARTDAQRSAVFEHGAMAYATLKVLAQPSAVALSHSPDARGAFVSGPYLQVYAERSVRRVPPRHVTLACVAWAAVWALGIAAMALLTRRRPVHVD